MNLTGNRCRCGSCGEHFNSLTPFDGHRTGSYGTVADPGDRRCLSVPEMVAKGWSRNAAGFWITKARKPRDSDRDGARRTGDLSQPLLEAA